MWLYVLIKRLSFHSDHGNQSAMSVLSKKYAKIRLKDLQVKIQSYWAETCRLEVFEKDSPNLVVWVSCEFMDLLDLRLPFLKDFSESVEILIMFILLLVAEIAHDVSKTNVQFFVGWSDSFKRTDLEVLLQEGVVLSLQAFF